MLQQYNSSAGEKAENQTEAAEGSAQPSVSGLNPAFVNDIMDEAKEELRFEID
jgi:hypothetical protein